MDLDFFIVINLFIPLVSSSPLVIVRDEVYSNGTDFEKYFPDGNFKRIMCISDQPRDALIWNTKMRPVSFSYKKGEATVFMGSELSSPPIDFEQQCKLSVDGECLSSWSLLGSHWNIVNSFDSPMGPVYDSRWENFTEMERIDFSGIPVWKNGRRDILKLGTTGAIVISIRSNYRAHIALCETENFESDFCYYIDMGDAAGKFSTLNVCEHGIPKFRQRRNYNCVRRSKYLHKNNVLPKEEWRTFVLTWEAQTRTIELFDPDKKILSFSDYNSTYRNYQTYYPISVRALDEFMRFRLHNYNFTLTRDRRSLLHSSPLIINNSQQICIDMLVGLCKHCSLRVDFLDASGINRGNRTIRRLSEFNNIEHNLPMWQHERIQTTITPEFRLPITLNLFTTVISENTDFHQDYWAITQFEYCLPEGTVKSVKLVTNQDYSIADGFTYYTMCQRLSYVNPKSEIEEAMKKSSTDSNTLDQCRNYNIGQNCALQCDFFFQPNCSGVKVCLNAGCSCVQGWQGPNCTTRCSLGSYGVGCSKKCNDCIDDSCDSFTGKCHLGCKSPVSQAHEPLYCDAVKPPPRPFIDDLNDTYVRVYLYEQEIHRTVDATFQFEIEYMKKDAQKTVVTTNGTAKIIYYAIFDKLIPEEYYSTRAIMRIQLGEKSNETKGDAKYFRSLCKWGTNFQVIPGERSLLIEINPNEDTFYCRDWWDSIDASSIPTMTRRTYVPEKNHTEIQFPYILSELKPSTSYRVCFNDRANESRICGISSTLEAAPSSVANLQIKSITTFKAEISWEAPRSPNGILKSYSLTMKLLHFIGCEFSENIPPTHSERSEVVTNFDAIARVSYNLTNLLPYVSYEATVVALNSKVGNEINFIFSTKPRGTPTEVFSNVSFSNDTITWNDPDNCETITGPIQSSRVIITGVSENVDNFSSTHDTKERFLDLKTLKLLGNEIYQAKIHVLRETINASAYIDIFFFIHPVPPLRNEGLQLVEVNESTTTLRWPRHSPLTLSRLDYYGIRFLLKNATLSDEVRVYLNETCYLWRDSFCKTVYHPPLEIKQSIVVKAYNKKGREPGESFMIYDNREEQVPGKPEIISITDTGNGTVHLKWQHPSITGGPITQFSIRTLLFGSELEDDENLQSLYLNTVPIHKYEPEYSTHLYLLPSTRYVIYIQAETSKQKGNQSTETVETNSALGFQYEPQIVLPNDTLIDIVIPPVINNTKNSQLYIIVKGPSICKQGGRLSDEIMKSLQVDDDKAAWRVAIFSTPRTANMLFTIGDDHIYDTVSNCPLRKGSSYVIVLLVYDAMPFRLNKIPPLLIWQSKPILVGEVLRTHHESWAIPLALVFFIICATTYYCSRRGRCQKYFDKTQRGDVTESISHERKNSIIQLQNQSHDTHNFIDVRKSLSSPKESMEATSATEPIYEEIPDVVDVEESRMRTLSISADDTDTMLSTLSPYEAPKNKEDTYEIIATQPAYLEIIDG